MAWSLPFIALSFMASIMVGVFVSVDGGVVRLGVVLVVLGLVALGIVAVTLHPTLEVVDLLVGPC